MKSSFVCPYCFEQKPVNEIKFRCRNRRCALEPDEAQGRYYGNAPPMEQAVFETPGKITDRATCIKCGQDTNRRVCPVCHNTLPATITSDREKIIALIGTRGSGKSIFVAVLIHEFLKRIAPSLGATLNFVTEQDKEQYYARFYNPLYRDHQRIQQTMSADIASGALGANRPILTKLKKEYKKLFGKSIVEFTLVFFDAAGEDFQDEEVMHQVSKYIAHSDGIIFLIDPFSNNNVRGTVSADVLQAASVVEAGDVSSPKEVIERVVNITRDNSSVKDKDKIKMPVAVAFSKLDAIESLLEAGSALENPSPHLREGKFNIADGNSVDEEIRGLLAHWEEEDFLASLDMNYENARLFAFSALGNNPHPDGRIDKPTPNRIEDALIWMLNELKLL